jgi:competence protein ComEA
MTDELSQEPPTARGITFAVIILIIAIIAAGALLIVSRPQPVQIVVNPPVPTATAQPTSPPPPVTVYITGAVISPQTTVQLPAGSRVQDALEAAGGIGENADLERVNLAAVLRDGDHVHVFALGEDESAAMPTPTGDGIVFVNTATLDELVTLPRIGPALAQRIIDYRQEYGPFADFDQLGEVSGIGPTLIEGLRGLVSFD